MKIIILGPPGAGKGTQAQLISNEYGISKLSTGDILRSFCKEDSDLCSKAKTFMDTGHLVPDDLIIKIVKAELKKPEIARGYILDGFPRTVFQAEALDDLLLEMNDRIDYVFILDASLNEIVKRLSGRRSCPGCGRTYHIFYNPPEVEGRCNFCGSVLFQRQDDSEETINHRLHVYENQTKPLIKYYTKKGVVYHVNGLGEINDIYMLINSFIRKRYSISV
jgi:adenylate kinase